MNQDSSDAQSVVQIDENNLDKECIRLPSDYLKFAHKSVDAKWTLDEMENKLKVVHADLSKEVRSNPQDFGIDKFTEAVLVSTVLGLERYQKGLMRVQQAKYEADLAQAVVWALEHKKRTLTLLVELHGMGYFSSPKVSERGREAVEDMTKKKVRRWKDDE